MIGGIWWWDDVWHDDYDDEMMRWWDDVWHDDYDDYDDMMYDMMIMMMYNDGLW